VQMVPCQMLAECRTCSWRKKGKAGQRFAQQMSACTLGTWSLMTCKQHDSR
jgi:hypothetical protein